MSFCICSNPKPKIMKVLHKEFHVCAKSEGGCGLEMSSGKARVLYADRATVSVGGKVVGHFTGNVNPHNKVTCPKCAGACTVIKRDKYSSRLVEEDCEYCNGSGKV